MQGRFASKVYELQGSARAALADIAELLIADRKNRKLRAAGRVLTLASPFAAMLVAMLAGDGAAGMLVFVWGLLIGIPMWSYGAAREIPAGRLPFLGALLHALCPNRDAPVKMRVDLRSMRSPAFHKHEGGDSHSWTQRWLDLDVALSPGLSLGLARDARVTESSRRDGPRRLITTVTSEALQGALRYDSARSPGLHSQGAQLPQAIAARMSTTAAAQVSRCTHEPGLVTIHASARLVNDIALGHANPAVESDLQWLYAAWGASGDSTPWFASNVAGQYAPELSSALVGAAAESASAARALLPVIALGAAAFMAFVYGALTLSSASTLRADASNYRGFAARAATTYEREDFQRQSAEMEALADSRSIKGWVLIPGALLLGAAAGAFFLKRPRASAPQ